MRFLADMGIARTVVRTLRDLGHDAIHLSEIQGERLPDDSVIKRARQEDRVILTHDLDFSRLMCLGDRAKPSAITFRLGDMRPENVLAHLMPALELFAAELADGALVSVNDTASRCRSLPVRRKG